ncbi:MAG: glycosyltransferase family 1 protein [Acidocella sp.]|nr:glycosyltransferase family 1 protein [Acidocella sp.]
MTVWFDVEDLIRFFQQAIRPTGIQRFSFETYSAAARLATPGQDIGFCRRDTSGNHFKRVDFTVLEAGIRAIAEASHPVATPAPAAAPPRQRLLPPWLVEILHRIPPQYRRPLGVMARSGLTGLGAARDLATACLNALRPSTPPMPHVSGRAATPEGPDIIFGPGDWLINLGASWERPYTPDFLTGLTKAGAGFAMLAHDMIPDLFPEWCTETMVRDFSRWLDETVPHTDIMFSVSQNTARDLTACLARRGKTIAPPVVIPVGNTPPRITAPLPPVLTGPYVLMVGTIEARKNHGGMLRVWRRLLATMPEAKVPTLVFAGKAGWLTADLMQQLENAHYLNGKIRFIDRPSETCLASLYQHCLFTLFPSLYEGWGLPVTESLSFGKPVAASNGGAIPEAGGNFCAYFDPDNISAAYDVIRNWIEIPTRVAALSAHIQTDFTAYLWKDTAAALLARCAAKAKPATMATLAHAI